MPLDPSAVGHISPVHDVVWDSTTCLLYALSVGAGQEDLAFVTENTDRVAQRTVPSMTAMLCQPPQSTWERLGDFDWTGLVHADQEIVNHRPLPVSGAGRATTEIVEMLDKGSAALVTTRTILRDRADDGVIATGLSTTFIRGAGGFGGNRGTSAPVIIRDRRPDHVIRDASDPSQALLYRINGDRNPLHSSPEFARRAGFDRPILHGLCALGFATRALVQVFCADQPELIESVGARFLSPSYPGDTFTTWIWEGAGTIAFETRRTGGDTVLANGTCRLRDPDSEAV
jgi:acyl dehydratase